MRDVRARSGPKTRVPDAAAGERRIRGRILPGTEKSPGGETVRGTKEHAGKKLRAVNISLYRRKRSDERSKGRGDPRPLPFSPKPAPNGPAPERAGSAAEVSAAASAAAKQEQDDPETAVVASDAAFVAAAVMSASAAEAQKQDDPDEIVAASAV